MKIDIITLFPKMFSGPFDESIVKRGQDKELVEINIHDLRKWGLTERKTVDDRPYGGGVGMILMVEPFYNALKDLKTDKSHTVLLTPRGSTYDQQKARQFSKLQHLILICGHYEGFDQRIADYLVDEEISIGNYVLTGGEIPAMAITDSIVRLIPGVLAKPEATEFESFSELKIENLKMNNPLRGENYIEHPQYTRPEVFEGWEVPKVLLSGNHKQIEEWRKDKN